MKKNNTRRFEMKTKNVWFKMMFIGLLGALVLPLAGFVSAPAVAAQTVDDSLSDAEAQGILYMREEEKLARDVYTALHETWGLTVFQNIARSEQAHMDAIKTLIDRYGLVDPVAGAGVGEFANADLQDLYDELVARGSSSLTEALAVGALIEELDITDLEQHIAEVTHEDVKQVYENLLNGSKNHLRAFVGTLGRYGETYEPVYLDQATFDQIVAAGPASGPAGSGRGSRNSAPGSEFGRRGGRGR
jgi:hypothetical protein